MCQLNTERKKQQKNCLLKNFKRTASLWLLRQYPGPIYCNWGPGRRKLLHKNIWVNYTEKLSNCNGDYKFIILRKLTKLKHKKQRKTTSRCIIIKLLKKTMIETFKTTGEKEMNKDLMSEKRRKLKNSV